MIKEYHFVKPKPATKEILTNKKVLFQDKYDGISIEAFIDEKSNTVLYGRGVLDGKDSNFTRKFPELSKEIYSLNIPPMSNFLAEAIVLNPKTKKQDCGLASGRSHRNDNIQYYATNFPAKLIIHDVVTVDGKYVGNMSYLHRLHEIKKYVDNSNFISVIDVSTDGIKMWEDVVKFGKEGLIIRDPVMELGNGGIYKLKQEITEDVYCKGEYQTSLSKTNSALAYTNILGERKVGVFANLVCYQLTKEGKEIPVADVGGGFSQKDRIMIQQMIDENKITPLKPLVLEVKANDRHESGKLRGSNFLRIRTDKPWKECIINEIKTENKQKTIGDF